MDLNIPELDEILDYLQYLKQRMDQYEIENSLTKTWYNVDDCHKLKGGCSLNTFKSNYQLQPKCGIPDGKVGGRKVWHRDTVAEWLNVTDDKIPEYRARFKNEQS